MITGDYTAKRQEGAKFMKKYEENHLIFLSNILIVMILVLLIILLSPRFSFDFNEISKNILWMLVGFFAAHLLLWRKYKRKAVQKTKQVSDPAPAIAQSESPDNKRAVLEVLQNQMNPHFLYNTLDAIRGYALENGVQDIAEMTEKLSQFFRYSISNKDNLVTLAEEIKNTKDYFDIQKYRFHDRFSLEFIGNHEAVQSYLPKLTFQPIVENAVYHGLEPQVGKGTVTIRTELTKQTLTITVSDNGIGMPEEQLNRINDELRLANGIKKKNGRGEKHGGMALENVNHRIRLLFGEEYGIRLYSLPGVGTDVVIDLPNITDEDRMQYQL